MDSRIIKLADNLVNYSCQVQKGEKVLITYRGISTEPLVKALIKKIYEAGGIPFESFINQRVLREMLLNCTEEQIKLWAKWDAQRMKDMDCYIGVTAGDNVTELADVPSEKIELYERYYMQTVHHQIRVPNTKWVVLRYPNDSMAQLSNTSLEGFEDFYFDVCNVDYNKMSKAMDPLVEIMEKTDKVRIVSPDTDLTFSIKGIPVIKCAGECNIPDGEVYTAPVRDSVNGKITYNTPSVYLGSLYENICFEFENGKIIKATSTNTEKLNKILDTDEGARYIGEFAIGVNPYITTPMKETLFDEKIQRSIHFTPGNSYDNAFNGNRSSIHWDIVLIQATEYGGGEIYFDDVLIRKDGIFVIDELKPLNPENLK